MHYFEYGERPYVLDVPQTAFEYARIGFIPNSFSFFKSLCENLNGFKA